MRKGRREGKDRRKKKEASRRRSEGKKSGRGRKYVSVIKLPFPSEERLM